MTDNAELAPDQVGVDTKSFPLFRCPLCGKVGMIDVDQFHGRTSIQCELDPKVCVYHEKKDWSNDAPR